MSSVSSSVSSPDALGPEGDALYLISSPVPDFSGRQSWVPSYTIQTPRRQDRAPRRTPKQQSSQTMRFNDILLPTSPHVRNRSMSPTKMQSEGNLSPWRIRVTVEAEHEDDENTQDGPRKKLKPSTITTKVPLKDEESTTLSPRKRRGRPRKSDVREKSLSPIKGSPGRTPKQQLPDSVKRPRGRPRKSMQNESLAQSIEAVGSPVQHNMKPTTFDGVLDKSSPAPFMTVDVGSPSEASSEPDPFLDMAGSGAFDEQSPHSNSHGFTPPVISNSSNFQNAKPTQAPMGVQQATPQASVSPLRGHRGTTPQNTLHAGHTPRKVRRSYPTPTSSSLVDGNGESSTTNQQINGTQSIADPTDVHHEYDTIMESEDFSMVSLDTLPSAKQGGLSSILSSSKSSLKPFSKNQSSSLIGSKNRRTTKSPQTVKNYVSGPSTTPPGGLKEGHESDDQVVHVDTAVMNASILAPSLRPTVKKARKKPHSLAGIVRLGLSLHDALVPVQNFDTENSDKEDKAIASAADRLKRMFSDFDTGSQSRLQAGLEFGQLVARGTMRSRRLQRREETERELDEDSEKESSEEEEEPVVYRQQAETFSEEDSHEESIHSPEQADDFSDQDLPEEEEMSRTQRIEAEWRRERELVSRQIDMAGSDNVIVLDSDNVSIQNEAEDKDDESDEEIEEEQSQNDEDYRDVWQEEARNNDSRSIRHSTTASSLDEEDKLDATDYRQGISYRNNAQGNDWNPENGEIPPLGRSRTAQLRDQEVDFSLLLKPRDTPKSRQYYGNSPRTGSSQRQQSNRSSGYGGVRHDTSSPIKRTSLGASQVKDEPENVQDDLENDYDMLDEDDLIEEHEVRDQERGKENEEQEQGEEEDDNEEELEVEDEDEEPELENNDMDGESDGDNDSIVNQSEEDNHTSFDPSVSTPEQMNSGPKQSWFRRMTNNFTPGWWTTSKEVPLDESQSPPFPANNEQTPSLKRSRAARDAEEARQMEQITPVMSTIQSRIKKYRLSSLPSPKVLTTSGYFTDAHYIALRRLYWEAKRYPERFPYHPTERRDEMLGDSLWTSDGEHGLPIARIQFGILDRFVSELISADIRNGGRGQIGWTEDDLHKRLFSIIVGEEIRRERREQRLLSEMR